MSISSVIAMTKVLRMTQRMSCFHVFGWVNGSFRCSRALSSVGINLYGDHILVLPCIILLIRPFRKERPGWSLAPLYIGPTAFIVPIVMLALVSFLGDQPIIYFDTAYYHLPLAQKKHSAL